MEGSKQTLKSESKKITAQNISFDAQERGYNWGPNSPRRPLLVQCVYFSAPTPQSKLELRTSVGRQHRGNESNCGNRTPLRLATHEIPYLKMQLLAEQIRNHHKEVTEQKCRNTLRAGNTALSLETFLVYTVNSHRTQGHFSWATYHQGTNRR